MFFFFYFLFDLMLFQNCLANIIPYFSLIDELVTILLAVICILSLFNNKRKTALYDIERLIILLGILFLGIGFLSTEINKIQSNSIVIIKDSLAISKFVICYISGLITSNEINKELLLSKIAKKARIYIDIIFACGIMEIFFGIGMSNNIRFGVRCFKFLFRHETYLVSAMVILLVIIIANTDKRKCDKRIIYEALFVLIITFRSKALVLVISYFVIKIILKYFDNIKIRHIVIIGVLGILVTYKKISEVLYYGITAARPALYIIGFKIANEYFPLGSGLGTFASSLSGEYYSPLYYEYGINTVLGLRENMYSYMGDTFWPNIYAQYGYIGAILFLGIIICTYISIKKRYMYDYNKLLASFVMFSYILIASIAESIFTDGTGTFMFIIMSVYLGKNVSNIKNRK